jgi:hypothetical protein
MAKHIHHGWSTSEDEIPQPTSIITGQNLRKPQPIPALLDIPDIEAIRRNGGGCFHCGLGLPLDATGRHDLLGEWADCEKKSA